MEFYRTVDDNYRILLPKELRDNFNINRKDTIKMEINDNKIILTRCESDSKDNVVNESTKENNKISLDTLNRLKSMLDSKKPINTGRAYNAELMETSDEKIEEAIDETHWENGKLVHTKEKIIDTVKDTAIVKEKSKTLDVRKYNLSPFKFTDNISFRKKTEIIKDLDCGRCSKEIDIDTYVKVNNKYLCNSCTRDLINQLKNDCA